MKTPMQMYLVLEASGRVSFLIPTPYTLLFLGYPLPIHVGLSRRNDFLSNSDAVVLMNVSIFNGVSETQMKPLQPKVTPKMTQK